MPKGHSDAQMPVDRWAAAIEARRSRRSFDGRPVAPDDLEAMARHCETFRPFPAARAVVIPEAPTELFAHRRGDRATMAAPGMLMAKVVGPYGRITGAPSALAFAGRVASDEMLDDGDAGDRQIADFAIEEQIGYTGEAAVLEATALGLDTCWVAGLFSPSTSEALIGAETHEMVFAVSPLGHAAGDLSGRERYMFRMGKPKKRLRLEHIALGLTSKDWPAWAVAGVRAVQGAPSAVNRQPWRFRLDDGSVVVAADGPDSAGISKRIDCGIAMLHFELGVRRSGRSGTWEEPGTGRALDVARWRLSEADRPI